MDRTQDYGKVPSGLGKEELLRLGRYIPETDLQNAGIARENLSTTLRTYPLPYYA